MQREEGVNRLNSVGKSIAILELLVKDSAGLTIAHIASELGMRRSTVLGIMSSLEGCGFVARNGQGLYLPDLLAVEVAVGRLLNSVGILSHARPILDGLARKHGEAVYLTVLRDDEVIFLDIADYAYVLENGRVVLDGPSAKLARNQDVQEFYLGAGGNSGARKSMRDVKHYKRRKRWLS